MSTDSAAIVLGSGVALNGQAPVQRRRDGRAPAGLDSALIARIPLRKLPPGWLDRPNTCCPMTSVRTSSQEQPGVVAALLVIVACALVSCIAWYPLGGPVYGMTFAFRSIGCASLTPGSLQMFFCSAGVGLLQLVPAAVVLLLIFIFRKPLIKLVQRVAVKLPPSSHFLVAPLVATLLFILVWAGVHYTLATRMGLLPQIIFPAVVGLYTFIVVRYREGFQRALDPFFEGRDHVPRWLCFVGVFAVPFLIGVLVTQPWRQIVAAGPQVEHFIVLVALVVAFLLLTPRAGKAVPVAVPSGAGSRGGARGRGSTMRLVLRGSGYLACRLALTLGMAAVMHTVVDLCCSDVVLAHDCTPDRPWDCQNTSGFNTTTATGSGAAGAGAAAGGSSTAVSGGKGTGGGAAGGAPPGPSTDVLGGRDALQWLRSRDFIDADGRVTDKYRTWRSQLPDGRPDSTGLEALAGDVDDTGRIDPDSIAIVVHSPTIHQQELGDSCGPATVRMANDRLTGNDPGEAHFRGVPNGFHDAPPHTYGTTRNGMENMADAQPNVEATNVNLTLPQMQQHIENGNEVMVLHWKDPGYWHWSVVKSVHAQPEGPALIQINDPENPDPVWVDERWWAARGSPGDTMLVQPTGTAAPPAP